MPPPAEEVTNVRILERLLEAATDILKENVSRGGEKTFLLPLLFYKYLSDLSHSTSPEARSLHFPPEYRWENISNQLTDDNIGRTITNAIGNIAFLNPRLYGILDFMNYEKYNDAPLKKLILLISQYQLPPAEDLDLWSETYEYLLQRFPEREQDAEEAFYTPRDVVKLMADLVKPAPNESVYDPALASGCLSGLFHYLDSKHAEPKMEMKLIGQDLFSIASAVTKMDLLFYEKAEIHYGDALREPLCEKDGNLRSFDYVLANPPWNMSIDDEMLYEIDSKRFLCGIPDRGKADWVWIQHILASLKEKKGRVAVILDLGVLSRGLASDLLINEHGIRQVVIEQDVVEAVISLPGNLFYGTTVPCCLLLFNVNKLPDRAGKILFVDALNTFQARRGSRRFKLEQKECDAILEANEQWKTEGNFCRVAPLEEVCSNGYDLRPVLYVSKEVNIHYRPLDIVKQELVEAGQVRIADDLKVLEYLHRPDQENLDLNNLLETYQHPLSKDYLDESLRALLEELKKSREKELALEMEQREIISYMLFTLDVEKVPLGECANIYGGFTPRKREREIAELKQEGTDVFWVKAGDLEQEYIREAEGRIPEFLTRNYHCSRAVQPINTIVLAIYGGASTVGKTAILGIPAAINHAVCCINPHNEHFLDRLYLFCYLTYMRKRWWRDVTGGRQNLTLRAVKKHALPLPPDVTQQEIAAKLLPYNNRIRELKREIALLHQVLKA